MTRQFFARIMQAGIVKTRKHIYKRVNSNDLIKIVRDDGRICAVYAR